MSPERSLAGLVKEWGRKRTYVQQLKRWSVAYRWARRVFAYDVAHHRIILSWKGRDIHVPYGTVPEFIWPG